MQVDRFWVPAKVLPKPGAHSAGKSGRKGAHKCPQSCGPKCQSGVLGRVP